MTTKSKGLLFRTTVLCLLLLATSVASFAQDRPLKINYRLAMSHPGSHLFEVSIEVDIPAAAKAHYELSLAYACLKDPARAQHHLEVYRQEIKERDERVRRVRSITGFSEGAPPP